MKGELKWEEKYAWFLVTGSIQWTSMVSTFLYFKNHGKSARLRGIWARLNGRKVYEKTL